MMIFNSACVSRTESSRDGRQVRFHFDENFDLSRGRLRPQQIANMRDDFMDVHRRQFQRRGPGQFQEAFDNAVQAMQFAVDDAQARRELARDLRRQRAQILLQQLKMNTQRTQRIADLVREPLEQPREQIALFRRPASASRPGPAPWLNIFHHIAGNMDWSGAPGQPCFANCLPAFASPSAHRGPRSNRRGNFT